MSKNSKSRSNRKKKKTKSKANSSGMRNERSEQQNIEQVEQTAPEQLNTEITKQTVDETEAEIKVYEPETEASDSFDVQNSPEKENAEPEEAVEDEPEDVVTAEAPEETETFEESESAEEPETELAEEPETVEEPEAEEPETELAEESVTVEEPEPEVTEEQEAPEKESEPADEQEEQEAPEAEPAPEPKAKKKHTGIKVIGVLALLLAYCAAAIYGFFWIDDNIIDPDIYPYGTTINDVDVSNMTLEEAKKVLTDEWNKHTISIFDVYGKEIGEIDDFDFQYDIDDQLEHALSPGAETALYRFFQKDKEDISVKMDPDKPTDRFNRQFNDLSIVKSAEGDKPSKNAYIDKSDTEFRIVKEVIGNSVDTKALRESIFDSISKGEETFKFRRSDFRKAPAIISTSKVLLDERDYCIKNLSFEIRLRNPINDYTIPPSWLDKMIKVSKNGKVTVIDEQVSQFISEVLYPTFSSVGDTRRLKSAGGGTYTISGGTYGYTIDVEKEHTTLTSELKQREDIEREPYYSGRTPGKNWKNDIGNDYIEVSIEKQECWVVRNGKVVVDTPVVTGVLPRHATPKGVFYIVYKATHVTLKGRNDDGSKYESKVAYWMPFYLGFGLHDASWRGVFGGTIYVYNGSHGCVNCPPSIMPTIFSNTYDGMPVIVH